jgi:hypothetical protein
MDVRPKINVRKRASAISKLHPARSPCGPMKMREGLGSGDMSGASGTISDNRGLTRVTCCVSERIYEPCFAAWRSRKVRIF